MSTRKPSQYSKMTVEVTSPSCFSVKVTNPISLYQRPRSHVVLMSLRDTEIMKDAMLGQQVLAEEQLEFALDKEETEQLRKEHALSISNWLNCKASQIINDYPGNDMSIEEAMYLAEIELKVAQTIQENPFMDRNDALAYIELEDQRSADELKSA